MSDINSGLPIRTQTPSQANYDDVVIKIGDGTTTTQLASVDTHGSLQSRLADAAGNAVTTQSNGGQRALDVGINVLGVQVDPRAIRALTSADVVTVQQGTSPWVQNLSQVGGSAIALGQTVMASSVPVVIASNQSAIPVTQSTSPWVTSVNNLPSTVDTNYGTVGASTIRTAAQIGNAAGVADFNNGATSAQTLRVAANLAVAGANVSATNPVPVSISAAPLGTPVNNYNTVAAVAAGASSNHIYTITAAKTFQGKKIWASASGLMKIEVRVSPDGSTYTTLWVGFNSTSEPNIPVDMDQMVFLESGSGSTIEVIRTNLDKKSMDVYSTISGLEV